MNDFDLIIIGTGSGNTIITPEYDELDIAIVERSVFGGTCLNRGCIPSKMLVHVADTLVAISDSEKLGINVADPQVQWLDIKSRIFDERINPIAEGGEDYRKGLENVTVFNGEASFVDHGTIRIGDEIIRGSQIVVATGASPVLPSIYGLEEIPFHTSDTIMQIEDIPDRLTIVGGGYIATEMAHIFSSFGSEVTMVVRGATLLPQEDISIRSRFTDIFCTRINLQLNTVVTSVQEFGGNIYLNTEMNGSSGHLETDALLVATGRLPELDTLNVAAAGVSTRDGYIVTDENMRTSVENIWALGDVTNPHQLKHTANAEAKVVSHNLIHSDLIAIDIEPVPHAVFTNPQVASVGATEETLDESGIPYVSSIAEYADVAYGWAMVDTTGFCKIIANPDNGSILGAHIMGPHASTLIHQLIQGMKFNQSVFELARGFLYIHPALSEVVENALISVSQLCESHDENPLNGS